ncbi:MAG: glycosyltransferase [Nanoarchaeota archaeon]|nr:glycosyltransferase [Nanoarchaeota archaeon]
MQNVTLHFFKELEARNIRYAVLRKVELILENIGNDIDILIEKQDEERARGIIGETAKKFGLRVYERKNAGGLYAILYGYIEEKLEFVRLDFTNPVESPKALLEKRVKNEREIYYIPSGLHEKKRKTKIKNILTYPWRLIFPPGKFVVIVGPDGVGKSTTAELAAQILTAFHVPVWHKHLGFRPKILPAKKGGKKSRVPGLLRFLYHTLDHILGFWFNIRPMLVRGRVVIGERYYYNFLIDPRSQKRYGVPRRLLRTAWFFTPKPDIVVLLSNIPQVIYERRQEHSVEEIARQLEEYRKAGMKAKTFLEVRTDKLPFEVAEEVALMLAPKKYKLAILISHPIQYHTPIFRALAKDPQIDLKVYYCWDFGVGKDGEDVESGARYQWDVPLLEGYKYRFLKNYSEKPSSSHFFGQINPGIIPEVFGGTYDALWVHGYSFATNWFAFFAARLKGVPILFRGITHALDAKQRRVDFGKRMILPLLFRMCGACLYIGKNNKEYYKTYGVPDKKLFHVSHVVDNSFFEKFYEKLGPARRNIRKRYGFPDNRPVILFLGRLVSKKRPMWVLDAYKKIRKNNACGLILAGEGPDRREMENVVSAENIPDVVFTGFLNQTEIPEAYIASDIFVLPSAREETWGLTVNEAMNFGLPIIVSDKVGCAPDLVRKNENGFIVSSFEELCGALEALVSSKETRSQFGAKSRKIISSWDIKQSVEGARRALQSIHD